MKEMCIKDISLTVLFNSLPQISLGLGVEWWGVQASKQASRVKNSNTKVTMATQTQPTTFIPTHREGGARGEKSGRLQSDANKLQVGSQWHTKQQSVNFAKRPGKNNYRSVPLPQINLAYITPASTAMQVSDCMYNNMPNVIL